MKNDTNMMMMDMMMNSSMYVTAMTNLYNQNGPIIAVIPMPNKDDMEGDMPPF